MLRIIETMLDTYDTYPVSTIGIMIRITPDLIPLIGITPVYDTFDTYHSRFDTFDTYHSCL